MQIKKFASGFSLAVALMTSSAFAVTNFTETFNSSASNWLNNASPTNATATWISTGGVDDSGYISWNRGTFTTGNGTTYPGFDPVVTQLMFRANAANDASGDAFVGNWISGGVISLSLMVRHNHSEALQFYSRLTPGGGAGASLTPAFSIAPGVWTEVVIPLIPIGEDNSPFLSYGGGGSANFNGIFSSMQDMQFGFYLAPQTEYTNLTMDIDNVTLSVPEPSTYAMIALGLGGLIVLSRRRKSLV